MAQLISRPAQRDSVLDLTYCAELQPSDFAAAAVALRYTSMFSGLRLVDVPVGDAIGALCDYARTSTTLSVLALSGVLPDAAKRGSARSLGDALAEGARAKTLPLTWLDWSHNEIRDPGVTSIGYVVAALAAPGLRALDLSECHATARGMQPLLVSLSSSASPASLESLRLASNEIAAKGTAALADTIRIASSLLELDLRATACTIKLVRSRARPVDLSPSYAPPSARSCTCQSDLAHCRDPHPPCQPLKIAGRQRRAPGCLLHHPALPQPLWQPPDPRRSWRAPTHAERGECSPDAGPLRPISDAGRLPQTSTGALTGTGTGSGSDSTLTIHPHPPR